jgi:hypothetical protein
MQDWQLKRSSANFWASVGKPFKNWPTIQEIGRASVSNPQPALYWSGEGLIGRIWSLPSSLSTGTKLPSSILSIPESHSGIVILRYSPWISETP